MLRMRFAIAAAVTMVALAPCPTPAVTAGSRAAVIAYVQHHVLHDASGRLAFWITPRALDPSHVARDPDPAVADMPFPSPRSWLVLIDDHPKANWGHPCRWVFVLADLRRHTKPLRKEFPPTVWARRGAGPEIPLVHVTTP